MESVPPDLYDVLFAYGSIHAQITPFCSILECVFCKWKQNTYPKHFSKFLWTWMKLNPGLAQGLDFWNQNLAFSDYPMQPNLNIPRNGRLKTDFSGERHPSYTWDYWHIVLSYLIIVIASL